MTEHAFNGLRNSEEVEVKVKSEVLLPIHGTFVGVPISDLEAYTTNLRKVIGETTFEILTKNGGLTWEELLGVLRGKAVSRRGAGMSTKQAMEACLAKGIKTVLLEK
ncbi:MAG: hypothetical protein ACRDBG_23515 [Waterburya sp.]